MKKRVHIFYSGLVHGVGFRFASERAATALGLSGWVRNLPDGRVEIICEGPEEGLNAFAKKIESVFESYIRDADVEWSSPTGEFEGFDIR